MDSFRSSISSSTTLREVGGVVRQLKTLATLLLGCQKAVITVLQNGLVVQNHYEILGATDGINPAVPWKSPTKYPAPHSPEVFIQLQDHANPVRFRNIWIRSLHMADNA